MACASCETLKAELLAAREEIAAWRAYEAGEDKDARAMARLGRWQQRFRLTMSEALILLALVDRNGMPASTDALVIATRARPGRDHAREIESNLVRTLVCRMRKALDGEGLGDAVQTLRHVGYYVPPLAATALRSRVGEA